MSNVPSMGQLTGSEKRALLLWVLAGIAGLFFAHRYFFQAFPEASVDFKVTRPQALERAKKFVAGLGENVDGYKSAIEFGVDEQQKVYLERELGLQKANELASSQVNLWYWSVRFYKPLQEEEYSVRVNPAGQIVGYEHVVPAEREGAKLDRAAAQAIATNFFTQQLGKNAGEWTLLNEEANSERKPNRVDWDFTWEKPGLKVKEAPYREKIHVAGDKPAGAAEGLHVPEEWRRSYKRLRSGNDRLAQTFFVLYFVLLAVAVGVAIVLTLANKTSWSLALRLGAVAVGVLFLQGLNDWPLWGSSYETKSAYSGFVLLQILKALAIAVFEAFTISIVLPAAEPLYRQSQPNNLRLSKLLTWRGICSKEFFSSATVGICLAAAHIGFVVVFYTVATKFGAWAPQEVNYSDAVNTGFPWISGVAIGLLASMNEEFTFRLFAIPFFTRFTKSRWIAVIVPAFLWGFLHSNYPQEPAYIRGVEVGLIGIVAGLVMLRWGILATLIWHYTVDASLVGLFLVRSDNLYFKISGVVVGLAAAAPLVLSAVSYLRRGQFENVDDLKNAAASLEPMTSAEPAVAVPQVETVSGDPLEAMALSAAEEVRLPQTQTGRPQNQALSGAALAAIGICIVLGGLGALKLKQERIGDYLRVTVNAQQAAALSDAALRNRGLDPKAFHHATQFLDNSDPAATEFLREKIGVGGVNKLYADQIPIGLWGTRYFKDSDAEEYFVVLRANGALHSIHHTIAENAAGASLSKEEAIAQAEKYLKTEKNVDLTGWSLVDSDSKKRPHRIDHTLTWQQTSPLDPGDDVANHAYERIDVNVTGDEAGWYRTYVKIPDEWRRKREEEGLSRTLFLVGKILLWLALGAAMFVTYFQHFRSEDARSIPWRRISKWAMWSLGAIVLTIAFGDRLPQVMEQYDTAVSLKGFYLLAGILSLVGTAFSVGALILAFGIAWFYCRRAFGEASLPSWAGMPGLYYRDALFIGAGGVSALIGLQSALSWANGHFPTIHRFASLSFSPELAAKWPAASALGATLSHSLLLVAVIGAIGGFFASYVKSWIIRIPILLVGAATMVGDWGNAADFLQRYAFSLILLTVVVLGVSYVARLNLLGIFLVVFGSGLLSAAMGLLGQPNESYHHSAYALFFAIALVLGWPLVKWLTATTEAGA